MKVGLRITYLLQLSADLLKQYQPKTLWSSCFNWSFVFGWLLKKMATCLPFLEVVAVLFELGRRQNTTSRPSLGKFPNRSLFQSFGGWLRCFIRSLSVPGKGFAFKWAIKSKLFANWFFMPSISRLCAVMWQCPAPSMRYVLIARNRNEKFKHATLNNKNASKLGNWHKFQVSSTSRC